MSLTIYAFIISTLFLLVYRCRRIGRRPAGYPPGPSTLPLIGNLHLMPREKAHLQFQKWAETHGPVYSLILGTKVMIVLSSDMAVKDLLDKRSGIYSSRPESYIANILSGGLRFSLMEYGETWRKVRKVVHQYLNITAVQAYIPYQDLENKAMLVRLLEQPEHFIETIHLYTNSLTTQMIFGYRTISTEDPKFKQFFQGFERFSDLVGAQNAALVDFFPILRSLPDVFLPLRRYAKQIHRDELNLYLGHWLHTKRRIQDGTAQPSFCVDLARTQKEEGWSDQLAAYASGVLLEAGSDTTSATLVGFIQAIIIFPEVAKAVQEEVDRVCGARLPELTDDLPYVRCCIKESMRWMPTAILGVPHAVTRDDEYMGYTIPKDASVIANVWTLHRNPQRYPEPDRFDPSRYIGDAKTSIESANSNDPSQRDHFLFGAGRRFCQGTHIAERSLFLGIARLLWAFNIDKAIDVNGNIVCPNAAELTEGILVQPRSFPASIRPRSQAKVEAIRREWKVMEDLLDDAGQWKVPPESAAKKKSHAAADI